jgi:hypothetical protein
MSTLFVCFCFLRGLPPKAQQQLKAFSPIARKALYETNSPAVIQVEKGGDSATLSYNV